MFSINLNHTAREMLLWPHLAEGMPYQGDELAQALARAYLSYLTQIVTIQALEG